MTHREFMQLSAYSQMRRRAPRWSGISRRTAKKGSILVLRTSRVQTQVGLERVFSFPPYQQPIVKA